mgnify:CR=1 FL=1
MLSLFIKITYVFSLCLLFTCMDPIFEPKEQYSSYQVNSFFDPSLGFPNGGFEDDLDLWQGRQEALIADLVVDSSSNMPQEPIEGSKSLSMTLFGGGMNVNNAFTYNPGDTLAFSFDYMIPDSNRIIPGHSAFEISVELTAVDENGNYLDFSWWNQDELLYSIESENTERKLIADGNWHTLSAEFLNSSLEVKGVYFGVQVWEWSRSDWTYNEFENRYLNLYFDNFQVQKKITSNPKPTDFSILKPGNGDIYDLDTLSNFQTIPFIWEESSDSDTLLYTNRLVSYVPCINSSLSNGFEDYDIMIGSNPETGTPFEYKMPDGFGTFPNWFYGQTDWNMQFNTWVTDTVARSGSHSLRMGATKLETEMHTTTLLYTFSRVDLPWINRDRIKPGTVVSVKGYAMTPSDDRMKGNNKASLVIISQDEEWQTSTSTAINSSYEPDVWHPFEVNMTIPERLQYPNTTKVYISFRYVQYNGELGTTFFDDITISTSSPINFYVTEYYDVMTENTSSVMSAYYIKNLFSFVKTELTGINFGQVDFEWGILATDLNTEVPAINSPVTFTVLDSGSDQNNIGLSSSNGPFQLDAVKIILDEKISFTD